MLLEGCLYHVHGLLKFGNFIHILRKSQVTLKNNISENATKNRLYQMARFDASFISTSSALTGLIRPAVSQTFFLELQKIYHFYTQRVLNY